MVTTETFYYTTTGFTNGYNWNYNGTASYKTDHDGYIKDSAAEPLPDAPSSVAEIPIKDEKVINPDDIPF